jgi:hypothetical protein
MITFGTGSLSPGCLPIRPEADKNGALAATIEDGVADA